MLALFVVGYILGFNVIFSYLDNSVRMVLLV